MANAGATTADSINVQYSLDGGGNWRDATPKYPISETQNLSASGSFGFRTLADAWKPISQTADTLLALNDETIAGPFSFGFDFPYFDRNYRQFWISSNGWISLVDPNGDAQYVNNCLTSVAAPGLIAPFWDDLNPARVLPSSQATARVDYKVDDQSAIIQYSNVRPFSGDGDYTFQVELHRDGIISFRYLTMTGVLTSATIGVADDSSTRFIQPACNGSYAPGYGGAASGTALTIDTAYKQHHTFTWDLSQIAFTGQSDNVVLRARI